MLDADSPTWASDHFGVHAVLTLESSGSESDLISQSECQDNVALKKSSDEL